MNDLVIQAEQRILKRPLRNQVHGVVNVGGGVKLFSQQRHPRYTRSAIAQRGKAKLDSPVRTLPSVNGRLMSASKSKIDVYMPKFAVCGTNVGEFSSPHKRKERDFNLERAAVKKELLTQVRILGLGFFRNVSKVDNSLTSAVSFTNRRQNNGATTREVTQNLIRHLPRPRLLWSECRQKMDRQGKKESQSLLMLRRTKEGPFDH